ncbi:hypothetical protein BC830DRAFT_1088739 [Chytriomyces sp. MP71]|nr:hypothetical protein BC830DRAFT_1088739 [Chytriomyces sp. MP71]
MQHPTPTPNCRASAAKHQTRVHLASVQRHLASQHASLRTLLAGLERDEIRLREQLRIRDETHWKREGRSEWAAMQERFATGAGGSGLSLTRGTDLPEGGQDAGQEEGGLLALLRTYGRNALGVRSGPGGATSRRSTKRRRKNVEGEDEGLDTQESIGSLGQKSMSLGAFDPFDTLLSNDVLEASIMPDKAFDDPFADFLAWTQHINPSTARSNESSSLGMSRSDGGITEDANLDDLFNPAFAPLNSQGKDDLSDDYEYEDQTDMQTPAEDQWHRFGFVGMDLEEGPDDESGSLAGTIGSLTPPSIV